jgi:serine/threonine protein kinase
MAKAIPTQIDRYQVLRLLGEGAMGKVFLCQDPKLQRTVAIKVLSSEIESPEMRERFRLEVRAVSALKHPNIVELYDFSGEGARLLYFVMEHVPGLSLYETLRTCGPMPEETALCIAHELTQALAHAHEHNVVHRDIKPENILTHDGRLVLTDFGIVKAVAETNALGVRWTSSRTRVLGTPGFMAPEQFAGHKIDHRTDLFAVGAVMYNLTTGHVPYEGGTVETIYKNLKSGRYRDPRSHGRALTPQFCAIVARCIAPKPEDRMATATALREAVRALLTERGVTDIRDELRAYERNPREHRQGVAPADPGAVDALVAELKKSLAQTPGPAAAAVAARLDGKASKGHSRFNRFWLGLLCGSVLGATVMVAVHVLAELVGSN